MKNIAVFFGGVSCEHDISVITGVMTVNALDKRKFKVIPVYISGSGKWFTGEILNNLSFYKQKNTESLSKVVLMSGSNVLYTLKRGKLKEIGEIFCAVNCMHGGWGEDGGLYSFLKACKVPCTSSPLFPSSLAMDKEYTKIALKGIGVDFLPFVKLKRDNYYLRKDIALKIATKKLEFPLIVKPANLGSSIGIKVAKDVKELERAIDFAFGYDEKIIIEHALEEVREINCAAYKKDGEIIVSECEEVIKNSILLTFDDKYKTPAEKVFPSTIATELSSKVKEITSLIYRKLGFSGVVRIDFLIDKERIYVNEINTVPGSLAYYLFTKDTEEFSKMLCDVIENGVSDFTSESENLKVFDGGILNLNSTKIQK